MYPKKIYAASVAVFLANSVVAEDYTADGNVDMSVGSSSQEAVKIGDQTPWSVLDTLNEHCTDVTCDSGEWTIPCELTNASSGENTPNNIDEGTITMSVVATINRADDVGAMIEALKNLASQPEIHTVNTETYIYDDSLAPVAPGRMIRAKREERSIDQYSTAGTFYIRINGDNGSLRSTMRVGISAKVNDDELTKTLCTDLFTAGSAVAGTFTGGAAAAAGLTLASLTCG